LVDTHTTSEVFCQSSSCLDLVSRLPFGRQTFLLNLPVPAGAGEISGRTGGDDR